MTELILERAESILSELTLEILDFFLFFNKEFLFDFLVTFFFCSFFCEVIIKFFAYEV